MLRIYPVIIEMIVSLRPVMERLARCDHDLARQMRRASASVALNTAEGMCSRGKNRPLRYHSALGSMRETAACVEVAVAMGYIDGLAPEVVERMRHVTGTLVLLTRSPAAH